MMTMKKYSKATKLFSDDDHNRVSRLREEIISRVTEISLIMARTLNVKPPEDIREFVITDGPEGEVLEMSVIKTSETTQAGATVEIITWGCTCHTNKVCCSDPDCPPCS